MAEITDPHGQTLSGAMPRAGVATKLLYGFGSVAYGVKDGGFRALLLLYYNQVVGLPAHVVGLAIMSALIIDAALDPIIGQVSDGWRSQWGRRHPFMYAAAAPAAASYLLLWTPPAGWSDGALFAYVLVAAIVARTFITLYEIPSSALVAELTSDYNERTKLLSYRYFFGVWGALIIGVFTLIVLLRPTPEYPQGQLNPQGYVVYAWLAAALIFASIVVSAAGTHRFIPFLRQPEERRESLAQHMRNMLSTLSNRSFLVLMLGGLFKGAGLGLSQGMLFYWGTYLWRLDSKQLSVLLIDSFFSAAIALWLAPRLSARFGKKHVAIWSLAIAVAFGATPLILRQFGLFWANESPLLLPTLFLLGVVQSAGGIISFILVSSMIADVVEDSEVSTGRRSEGLFFAASSLVQKAVSGVGVFVSSLVLTLAHFPVGVRPAEIDPAILQRLITIYVPVLLVLYGAGIGLMYLYGIDRRIHEANLRKLQSG
jgi:glycoside/pentoside/hexuronide:cation symporter, GPH family